jgi:hypothetical protein
MPYRLLYKNHDRFLRVTAHGECSAEDVQAMIHEVAATCGSTGYDSVLVDISDVKGAVNLFDCLGFAASIAESRVRTAIVFKPIRHDDQLAFIETAAVNRGAVLRVFADGEAAEAWLTGSVPQDV